MTTTSLSTPPARRTGRRECPSLALLCGGSTPQSAAKLSAACRGRYLDDAKTPPGGTDTVNGACRTRTASITLGHNIVKIPLRVTMLATASGTVNNIEAFDGSGDSLASGLTGYLVNASDRCAG